MKSIRFWRLVSFAASPVLVAAVQAQAQAPRGPYYQRTTTPGLAAPHGAARGVSPSPVGNLSAVERGAIEDRLRPYTATSVGPGAIAGEPGFGNSYSSRPRVARRSTRPAPPASRNYFPTARVGQGPNRNVATFGRGGLDRCTPSRGGMMMGLR